MHNMIKGLMCWVAATAVCVQVAVAQTTPAYPPYEQLSTGRSYYELSDKADIDGFTVSIAGAIRTMKDKELVKIWNSSGTHKLWSVSMNADKRIYLTRYRENYEWNVTFWDPEHAQYSALDDNSNMLVMIIQESNQVRMHIGMPNGKFDCMYLNFGLPGTKLQDEASGQRVYFTPLNGSSETWSHFWNKPLCRTDAFAYAIGKYYAFSQYQPSETPLSPLLNSDIKDAVYSDDSTRIGTIQPDATKIDCWSNLESFGGSNGARMAMETVGSFDAEFGIDGSSEAYPAYVVYPNPSQGVIQVAWSKGFSETTDVSLKLFDLNGKTESSKTFQPAGNESEITWDATAGKYLPNGVYILEVSSKQGVFRKRIIIYCPCREN